MNYQLNMKGFYNEYDSLQDFSEIKALQGGSEKEDSFGDLLNYEQNSQKSNDQGSNLVEYAARCLSGFLQGLLCLCVDFKGFISKFQRPLNFDHDALKDQDISTRERVKVVFTDFLILRD